MTHRISEVVTFDKMREMYREKPMSPHLETLLQRCDRDGTGITFDDITLRAGYSEVSPSEADLGTFFSRRVRLLTPQVSAAMSDVTGKDTAVEMGNAGGLGIIHVNQTARDQADEVSAVKHHLHAFIERPITFGPNVTIGDMQEKMQRKGWRFREFPIVTEDSTLLGFFDETLYKIWHPKKNIRLGDVMRKVSEGQVVTAPEETDIERAYDIIKQSSVTTLCVVYKDGRLRGLYSIKDINRILNSDENGNRTVKPNTDSYGRLFAGASVGVLADKGTEERIDLLVKAGVDVIEVKQANVATRIGIDTVRYIKKNYPNVDVVAGNIDNAEGVPYLLDAGVDGIVVGIGPGSICKTRLVSGSGTPQIYAVADVVRAVNFEVPVSADGGARYSGDYVKALAVGAQSVTAGSVYAAAEESPGVIAPIRGEQYKIYKGMGYRGEMQKFLQSIEKYTLADLDVLVEQGVLSYIRFKGDKVRKIAGEIDGGIRSGMSLNGALNLPALYHIARFMMVTSSGRAESAPHDVIVPEEPNK